jgi:N-methylhydantoinase B/oxoprolinase/acetone carboxylase alpha subunit
MRVLVDAEVSVISERRMTAPRGAAGGTDGQPGANRLNGARLPAKWRGRVAAGDLIEIATPGGGGWGPAPSQTDRSGAESAP